MNKMPKLISDMETVPEAVPVETPLTQKRRRLRSSHDMASPAASVESTAGDVKPASQPVVPWLAHSGPNARLPLWDTVKLLAYGSEEEVDSEDEVEITEKDSEYEVETTEKGVNWEINIEPHTVLDFHVEDELEHPPWLQEPVEENAHFPVTMYDFEWREFPTPPLPLTERREKFNNTLRPGSVAHYQSPYDAFVAIWDQQIMTHIAMQTNLYVQQLTDSAIRDGNLQPTSRLRDWKVTDVDELYVFFAIMLAMGVLIKSRIEEYWSKENDIFCTPGFRAYMSLRRFQLLNKCLHFNDNSGLYDLNITNAEAKVYKLQPLLDHLNSKFSTLYVLGQNICLDESLIQWKTWHSFRQLVPNKSAKIGVKMYEICESATGYQWRFEIHTESTEKSNSIQDPVSGTIPSLVLKLLSGLEDRGHTVWMDNFYNSPALARTLKTRGFDCVGPLRTNRQFVSQEIQNLKKSDLLPGQVAGCTSGDVDLLVWRDKNLVALISTYHGNAVSENSGTVKPNIVNDYNICMGVVDKKDQMLANYPLERKRTKVWYKKVFRRILNVSALNAYFLFKTTPNEVQDRNRQKLTQHRSFRIDLVKSLLKYHNREAPVPTSLEICSRKLPSALLKHFPVEYDFLPSRHERLRRRCVQCKERTTSYCPACKVTLCAFKCFRPYHS